MNCILINKIDGKVSLMYKKGSIIEIAELAREQSGNAQLEKTHSGIKDS